MSYNIVRHNLSHIFSHRQPFATKIDKTACLISSCLISIVGYSFVIDGWITYEYCSEVRVEMLGTFGNVYEWQVTCRYSIFNIFIYYRAI